MKRFSKLGIIILAVAVLGFAFCMGGYIGQQQGYDAGYNTGYDLGYTSHIEYRDVIQYVDREIIKEVIKKVIVEPPQPVYPVVTIEDILNELGIEVIGEIWDKPNSSGKKMGDYQPTEDQLHLIYNVLSSLPPRFLENIESITIVPLDTPGAGGLIIGEEIVIVGIPDLEGARYTARVSYISKIYHEIGHIIDRSLLSEEKKIFDELHARSKLLEDYVSLYGSNSRLEDFSTMVEAYTLDTRALLERTGSSSVLREKFKFMINLFSDWIEDQKVTYIYKVEADATIIRTEVKIGGDGLPILTETISQKEWYYKSRVNPQIEAELIPKLRKLF